MSVVYSRTFLQLKGLNGTATAGPTSSYRWVIKSMDVYWGGGAGTPDVFLEGAVGQTIWFNQFSVGGGQYASFRGYATISNPFVLTVVTAAAMDITVAGYQLTLP